MNDINVKQQHSSALKTAESALNSANKLLYIVVMEDPTIKEKHRYFAVNKIDKTSHFAEVVGYEISNAQSKKIKTWNDAVELANKGLDVINITFPWHRIISIRNVTYKAKVQ